MEFTMMVYTNMAKEEEINAFIKPKKLMSSTMFFRPGHFPGFLGMATGKLCWMKRFCCGKLGIRPCTRFPPSGNGEDKYGAL